jgi:hypothetical protein
MKRMNKLLIMNMLSAFFILFFLLKSLYDF